jgi:von Willebrand factor type A domain
VRFVRRALTAALALGASHAVFSACGSRSGLLVGTSSAPPPTSAFCATSDYTSGGKDLAIYLLLDKSESMKNDEKWQQATAAIDAFVHDPSMNGVAIALQYFPLDNTCDYAQYTSPVVPVGELPAHAQAISDSLGQQKVDGETPTLPALRGAIEYSRAFALAEPTRSAVVALVTDGEPNACDSSPESIAAVAEAGATGQPQVLTFAIGLATGFTKDLKIIAAKGGTGEPIVVNKGPTAGQELVTALRGLRDSQVSCRFAVPPVAGAEPKASDVRVGYRTAAASEITGVVELGGSSECGSSPNGFFLDDPQKPTGVELCPALCSLLQQSSSSIVTVVDGCAGSFDAGTPTPTLDGGNCGGVVSSYCVPACGSSEHLLPSCVGGLWQCPPGTVSENECTTCAPVPHVCCQSDGTIADAPCIDGAWKCAPGAKLYGEPGCTAPDVCAKTLPCAVNQYCETPSYQCGTGVLPGHCVALPSGCPGSGISVCGCDGKVYPNACQARALGVDVSALDSCVPPAGSFACGPYFCSPQSEICVKTAKFGGAAPLDDYACVPTPPGCSTGCGCSLCEPCPPGKLCNEVCTVDTATFGKILTCSEL